MKIIYTIGHSTHSAETFLEMLKSFKVETLVDIRSFPGSRNFPQFNQENLNEVLDGHGIRYIHLKDLGGRRKVQKDSKNHRWRNASFRAYADYMETPEFENALHELEKIATESPTAYMCSEAVWWRCHRSLVSDYLKASGCGRLCISWQLAKQKNILILLRQGLWMEKFFILMKICLIKSTIMKYKFKLGDKVSWNSEAGRVSGTIIKVHIKDFDYKGYTHHASEDDPQYEIKSSKTDHIAAHKGSALRKID